MSYIYNWIFGTEEIKADEKQLRLRHLLHKQIVESKLKLKKNKKNDFLNVSRPQDKNRPSASSAYSAVVKTKKRDRIIRL